MTTRRTRSRPTKTARNGLYIVSTWLPAGLLRRLDRHCRRTYRTRSAFMRLAIEWAVNAVEPRPWPKGFDSGGRTDAKYEVPVGRTGSAGRQPAATE